MSEAQANRPKTSVPECRIVAANRCGIRDEGDYVLYWMIAQRRVASNFALDYAVDVANACDLPLVIFEPLRIGYRWASDRHHAFIIGGMTDNAAACENANIRYLSYVEREAGEGKGLLKALAKRAAHVVTDEFPCFFLPKIVNAASEQLEEEGVGLSVVDSCGIMPLAASDRVFTTAYSFRRHVHKTVPEHIGDRPCAKVAAAREVKDGASLDFDAERKKWPALGADPKEIDLADLDIDHAVTVVENEPGGRKAGLRALKTFLDNGYAHYADDRNHPDEPAQSNLSGYLHYGHVGAHDVFAAVEDKEGWSPEDAAEKATGKREGWWGMSAWGEAFVDEFLTWRELGYVFCKREPDYTSLKKLPNWAVETLSIHGDDPREELYSDAELDRAQTSDPVWNAAQRQLVREGRIHNYLRMLWGKNVLAWSKTPEIAKDRLIEMNNRYALDGRDPNSYSGIFWIFGRFDRAWGPEREVFGKVRYMTSDSAQKKLKMSGYLEEHADALLNDAG